MFLNRAAALRACFPYWSGMEHFDPGTLAGKHDSLKAMLCVNGEAQGAASVLSPSAGYEQEEYGSGAQSNRSKALNKISALLMLSINQMIM